MSDFYVGCDAVILHDWVAFASLLQIRVGPERVGAKRGRGGCRRRGEHTCVMVGVNCGSSGYLC